MLTSVAMWIAIWAVLSIVALGVYMFGVAVGRRRGWQEGYRSGRQHAGATPCPRCRQQGAEQAMPKL
jgi:hypothetical protein